jgi:hypothetical protein
MGVLLSHPFQNYVYIQGFFEKNTPFTKKTRNKFGMQHRRDVAVAASLFLGKIRVQNVLYIPILFDT